MLTTRHITGAPNWIDLGTPAWNIYFRTPDADATAKAVEHAHGSVRMRPMDVADEGRMAILADRAGVSFGVWQPRRVQGLDVVTDPGALCWLELYTPDLPAAAGFFNSVFGWETPAIDVGGGSRTCVHPAGTEPGSMFAGIVPIDEDPSEAGSGPYWLPYFEVADPDAAVSRALEHGGGVRRPANDIPGAGRYAKLTDPYGARFAVIRSEQPQG
ncbi:VOC family protein [Streptomyces sp. MNU76]|uniref:VOC family protein n=1 Tax=Streptomyces sp. MNU76 TaxID=2560026 RepID=UPI001E39F3F2|nr:VOC family protein [Streptomyces sp. MNU76]MCC9705827.1 VOC family protein [Streptomyces sp. MNU76]